LDRPTGNRTLAGHGIDLSALGVEYVNAAQVPGLSPSPLSYVVTQHPLPNTLVDFWLMVLAVQPVAILMLNGAAEPEDIDLPPYWLGREFPNAGAPGAPLVLSSASADGEEDGCGREFVDVGADCVVRPLHCRWRDLEWRGPQLAVSWWRDQSAPPTEKFLGLERLIDRLAFPRPPVAPLSGSDGVADRSSLAATAPALVVHCAAGIGRAGVFAAADIGARTAALDGDLAGCSPDSIVAHLRQRRMNMVQTAEQYEFVHLVLPALTAQLRRDMLAAAGSLS